MKQNVTIQKYRRRIPAMLKALPNSAGLLKKELIVLSSEFDGFFITEREPTAPAHGHVNNGLPAFGAEIAALDTITEAAIIDISRGYSPMDAESFLWQTKFVLISTFLSDKDEAACFAKLGMLEDLDCRAVARECNPLHKLYESSGVYRASTEETQARYRKKASDIYIKTGTFPDFDGITAAHAKLFPPPKASAYLLKLAFYSLLASVGVFTILLYAQHLVRDNLGTYVSSNTGTYAHNNVGTFATQLTPTAEGQDDGIARGFGLVATLSALALIPLYSIVKPFVDSSLCKRVHGEPPPRLDLTATPEATADTPANAGTNLTATTTPVNTLLVLSTLINSADDIKNGLARLKTALNKNPRGHGVQVAACLLCDLKPAKTETVDGDGELVELARNLYNKEDNISIIIRKREFSRTQRMYQGFERKRGAVALLCRALRDSRVLDGALLLCGGEALGSGVKYIVALDYDTMPLMNSVCELVATALHPHNNAGIYVPRVTTTLDSSRKTAFATVMAGDGGTTGTTAYDSVAGEFYSDCFDSGTFTGKGLIDVDRFLESVSLPDERVLSHDILEGALISGGVMFCGDIEFSDSFPPTSTGYYKRLNRWIRGDLQNIPFIFDSRVKHMNKFKLFDNALKGILPALAFALAIAGIAIHSDLLVLIAVFSSVATFLPTITYELTHGGTKLASCLSQFAINVFAMPFAAMTSLDSTIRTAVRSVTRRRLLEWQTASVFDKTEAGTRSYAPTFILSHIPTFILSLVPMLMYVGTREAGLFPFALCFAWAISTFVILSLNMHTNRNNTAAATPAQTAL